MKNSEKQGEAFSRRGSKAFLAASAVAQLCALVRYTLMARLLGPEQLGLAATLILTAQFFESISDSGSDRFLIQDARGDEPEVQHLVQLVFLGRGLLIAAALLVFANPIAAFYRTPDLAPALMVLAVMPLIGGFLHLDLRRRQRTSDFRSEASSLLAAESLSLLVTVIAAYVTRDFTAILYGLIMRAVVTVAVSHGTAERAYAVGYSRQHAGRLAAFAAPLIANGLLLFVGSQGDRVLIANQVGLAELGYYSAIILLISYPASTLQRFMAAIYLPLVARSRTNPLEQTRVVNQLAGQTLLLATAMTIGFVIVAPTAVTLLYGADFSQPVTIFALVAILQSLRFVRHWPTTIALGMGMSSIVLLNNIARLIAIPAALTGLLVVRDLPSVLVGFILGELVALATALYMLGRKFPRARPRDAERFLTFTATGILVFTAAFAYESRSVAIATALTPVAFTLVGWIMWRERETVLQAYGMVRRIAGRR